jgi:hypothetical protein
MTGANFSSWFRADESSFYAEASRIGNPASGNSVLIRVSGAADNLSIFRAASNNTLRMFGSTNGVNDVNLTNLGTLTTLAFKKYSFALALNNLAVVVDSAVAGTDTSVVPGNHTSLSIGNENNASYWNGTIRKLAYYPKRLADAEIVALTQI